MIRRTAHQFPLQETSQQTHYFFQDEALLIPRWRPPALAEPGRLLCADRIFPCLDRSGIPGIPGTAWIAGQIVKHKSAVLSSELCFKRTMRVECRILLF